MPVTFQQARRLALSLEGTEEKEHWGRPSFRLGGKIFATLWPPSRAGSPSTGATGRRPNCEDAGRAVVKLPLTEQAAAVELDPLTFSTQGWAHQGWTHIELSRVSESELASLLSIARDALGTRSKRQTSRSRVKK